jgi:hypothetical protein
VDFQLIDESILNNLGFRLLKSDGGTPDRMVNSLHHEIDELSAQKVIQLAIALLPGHSERRRITDKTIKTLLQQGVQSGHIEIDHVTSPKMKEYLSNLR